MIIGRFMVGTTMMVIVREKHAAHIMTEQEYKWMYGQSHPERWKKDGKTAA